MHNVNKGLQLMPSLSHIARLDLSWVSNVYDPEYTMDHVFGHQSAAGMTITQPLGSHERKEQYRPSRAGASEYVILQVFAHACLLEITVIREVLRVGALRMFNAC